MIRQTNCEILEEISRREELFERFAQFGSDAPYFARIAEMREEKQLNKDVLTRNIESALQGFVDSILPKPVFTKPNLFNSEEDLDLKEFESQAHDRVKEQVELAVRQGFVPPSHFVRNKWFDQIFEELVHDYLGVKK